MPKAEAMRCEMPPDPAKADDQQRLAGNLALFQLVAPAPGPVSNGTGPTGSIAWQQARISIIACSATETEFTSPTMHKRDPPRIQRRHIHRIIPDAVPRHDLQRAALATDAAVIGWVRITMPSA